MSQSNVITSEASERYASALLELAGDMGGALRGVERDVKALKNMLKSSSDLTRLVRSPVINADDKAKGLAAVAETAGFHPLMVKFLGTVAANRRAHEIPDIIRSIEDQLARARGATLARVTSAKALTATQKKSLKDKLTKQIGRKVDVDTDVDPDLLGGFVVRIGSKLYDSSLRTKLADLSLALKEA